MFTDPANFGTFGGTIRMLKFDPMLAVAEDLRRTIEKVEHFSAKADRRQC